MNHRTRAVTAVVATIALAALAGCGTPPPAPRPDAGLPVGWTAGPGTPASVAASNAVDAARLRWQDYFTDPRLQALIERALVDNRDLRIAAAKVEQGRSQFRIARADRLPTFNVQASETRTSTPSDLNTGVSSKRYDLQGVLTWELDFWGRVAAMSDSARAALLATEEAQRQVRLGLVVEVASAYFALLEKDELIELAQATLQLRAKSLEIATFGLDIGGAEEEERNQALAATEQARATLAQLEHQRNVAANQLDYLVGGAGHAAPDLPAGLPLASQEPGVVLAAGVPSEVLLHRPDVIAAEQRLAGAKADVAAARAAYFPKVVLTTALGFASPALAGLLGGGAWSYQPLASLPVFDGGRTAGNEDLARSRQAMAVAEYEKTLRLAFREVSDQLSAQVSLRAQLDAALAGQRAQAARLKAAAGRYEAGFSSYRDFIEAQRATLAALQTTIEVRRASQDAAATLYRVLGGGVDAEPRPVAVAADKPIIRSLMEQIRGPGS